MAAIFHIAIGSGTHNPRSPDAKTPQAVEKNEEIGCKMVPRGTVIAYPQNHNLCYAAIYNGFYYNSSHLKALNVLLCVLLSPASHAADARTSGEPLPVLI